MLGNCPYARELFLCSGTIPMLGNYSYALELFLCSGTVHNHQHCPPLTNTRPINRRERTSHSIKHRPSQFAGVNNDPFIANGKLLCQRSTPFCVPTGKVRRNTERHRASKPCASSLLADFQFRNDALQFVRYPCRGLV